MNVECPEGDFRATKSRVDFPWHQGILGTPSPLCFMAGGLAFLKFCPKQGAVAGVGLWIAGRSLPIVSPPLNPTTVLARGVIPARGEFNEETASRKWSNCQAGRAVARTSEPRCSVQKCWVRPVNLFPLQERGDSGPSALLQTQALWR